MFGRTQTQVLADCQEQVRRQIDSYNSLVVRYNDLLDEAGALRAQAAARGMHIDRLVSALNDALLEMAEHNETRYSPTLVQGQEVLNSVLDEERANGG